MSMTTKEFNDRYTITTYVEATHIAQLCNDPDESAYLHRGQLAGSGAIITTRVKEIESGRETFKAQTETDDEVLIKIINAFDIIDA